MTGARRTSLGAIVRRPLGAALRAFEPLRTRRTRYELAICAIFREEAPFLDEWIRFHLGVGVSHFFLYNNFSTDHFEEVLRPWISAGVVTLTDWPVPVGQLSAYRHCLRRARGSCRWLALIDVDEFLFSSANRDLRPILRARAHLPGVVVWQVFFGSDGHVTRPDSFVTLSYRRSAGAAQTTLKTIANPRLVYKVGVHLCKFWGAEALDTAGRPVESGQTPVLDELRLNHYWSRSIEDLRVKVARGDASAPHVRDLERHLAFERTLNAEADETIIPLAEAILSAAP